ncbi:MAG: helix-turn-helix domain-containing protein [Woeseia sp.]
MDEQTKLGKLLKKIRDESDLSLLDINKAGGPDPSYINRVELGKVNPRAESVAKLARAIAAANSWPLEKLWKVMEQFFEAADLATPEKPDETVIRRKFREILKARQLDKKQINAAMAQASVVSMLQVLEGDDILEIRPMQDYSRSSKRHRETIILPAMKHDFPAGPRATLHVNGDLTAGKREQLKILAKLVERIIAE